MDLIISGLGLLLIFPVWRYILKCSLLDTHRDKLFDLRDNLRDTFAQNGWDMGSAAYKQLRDLLNGYLLYTEHFAYSEFNYIENSIRRNPELLVEMKERFEKNFSSIPQEQLAYVMKLRGEARRVMMSHMILSSFPLATLTLLLFPIVGIVTAVRAIVRGLKSNGIYFFQTVIEIKAIASLSIRLVIANIAQIVLIEDVVEEYSYRQSKCV